MQLSTDSERIKGLAVGLASYWIGLEPCVGCRAICAILHLDGARGSPRTDLQVCQGASAAAARGRERRACWPQNHTSVDASGAEDDRDSASDLCLRAGGQYGCAHPMARQVPQQRLEEKPWMLWHRWRE